MLNSPYTSFQVTGSPESNSGACLSPPSAVRQFHEHSLLSNVIGGFA